MIRRSIFGAALAAVLATTTSGALAEAPPPPQPAPAAPGSAAPATGPSGHLAFDAVSVSLGDVVRGQDAVATFTYRNTGDAPLHILSAKPG